MSKKHVEKASEASSDQASWPYRIKKAVFRKLPKQRWQRQVVYTGAGLSLLLVIFMVGSIVAFSGRTLPNTYVAGLDVGGMENSRLQSTIEERIAGTTLILSYKVQDKSVGLGELGAEVNYVVLDSKLVNHSVADYLTWFMPRQQSLPINLNQARVGQVINEFSDDDFTEPVPASFRYEEGEIRVSDGNAGFGLDAAAVSEALAKRLSAELRETSVTLEPREIAPVITKDDIMSQWDSIQERINQKYTLTRNGEEYSPSKKAIAGWLTVVESESITLDVKEKSINTYVEDVVARIDRAPVDKQVVKYTSNRPSYVETEGSVGIKVTNTTEAEKALIAAVSTAETLSFELKTDTVAYETKTRVIDDSPVRTYTYDVAVWGNVSADLATFKAQANATLNNPKGWASGGLAFQEVSSNGNFTLVLAQPERVGEFSSFCSNYYSCRVGRYVIINDDRWLGATPAWNNGGGSLRDYRHMVVNHETGHWLGFGHRNCGGPGQPAPVMQQQSISLQGCKFNPWPLPSEIADL